MGGSVPNEIIDINKNDENKTKYRIYIKIIIKQPNGWILHNPRSFMRHR